MNGMQMALKSLGIDPEAITQTVQNIAVLAQNLKQQMDRIEHKLDAVIAEKSVAIPLTENGEKND